MTNRRTFLGSALAAAAWTLGRAGASRGAVAAPAAPPTVEFFDLGSGAGRLEPSGRILESLADRLPSPERVEADAVALGHFRGLAHEGDGRVAYLYEATLLGPEPRRGLVKLDVAASSAFA